MIEIDYTALPKIPCPVCDSIEFSSLTVRFDGGRIVQCTSCEHIYLNPPPSYEILTAIYTGYHASEDDESVIRTVRGWVLDPAGPYQLALAKVGKKGDLARKKVLEIGTGPGVFLNECRKHGAEVTGIEPNQRSVGIARNHFGLDLLAISFKEAISCELLPVDSFDIAFVFEVIEHVSTVGAFVEDLSRVLKPGGCVFISTPNFQLFYLMKDAVPAVSQWQEHLHFFTPCTLKKCLERYGFRITELKLLSLLSESEREKQALMKKRLVRKVWERARQIPLLYRFKDIYFERFRNQSWPADPEGKGAGIFVCAEKR